MLRKKLFLLSLAALGIAGVGRSPAAVILDLVNPAGSSTSVPVGTIIHAQWLVSTSDVNGIADVQARIQTSINGGASADTGGGGAAPLFAASVQRQGVSGSTDQATFTTTWSANPSFLTLAKPTATYSSVTGEPTTTLGNEPLFGIITEDSSGDFETGDLFSANNGTQFKVVDIPFLAEQPGVVTFSPTTTTNGEVAHEYTDTAGANDISLASISAEGGFTVTITPTPEPASLCLLSLGTLGLLRRKR
jgi:hypothetical protein